MDWSNEEYVRLYTRDTADDLELSWGATALWRAMITKFDRSGLIPAKNGWRSLAVLTRIPVDVVLEVGPELIADGRIRAVDGGFFAPNFTEAQTASKSDKARQRESRDRRRTDAVAQGIDSTVTGHDMSRAVTTGHAGSRNVTLPLLSLSQSLAVAEPLLIPPDKPSDKPKVRRGSKAPIFPLPQDWGPNDAHRTKAMESSLDLDHEASQFGNDARAKDRQYANWDAAFHTWLGNAAKWRDERSYRGGRRSPMPVGPAAPLPAEAYLADRDKPF